MNALTSNYHDCPGSIGGDSTPRTLVHRPRATPPHASHNYRPNYSILSAAVTFASWQAPVAFNCVQPNPQRTHAIPAYRAFNLHATDGDKHSEVVLAFVSESKISRLVRAIPFVVIARRNEALAKKNSPTRDSSVSFARRESKVVIEKISDTSAATSAASDTHSCNSGLLPDHAKSRLPVEPIRFETFQLGEAKRGRRAFLAARSTRAACVRDASVGRMLVFNRANEYRRLWLKRS